MTLLLLMGALWESPRVPAGASAPTGLAGMQASDCGSCHQEIYKEWQVSIHAHAWTDMQFQKELNKDPDVAWLCMNCHTPAADQQPERTVATGDVRNPERSVNPSYSQSWQQEGVTCMSCHWGQGGAIRGPYGDTSAPHPVQHDPGLRDSQVCMGCHQAVAQVEDTLVCAFNTGVEWQESGSDQSCQSCHMPKVERPLVPGGPVREVRQHLFLGSGIPKNSIEPGEEDYYAQLKPAIDVDLQLPERAASGTLVRGTLSLHNARADHYVPSGDPERYLLARVQVRDAQGALLTQSTARMGQRWVWWPKAERLADNRIAPDERRELPLSFAMPLGAATVSVLVEHYRMSPENAEYHALEGYPIKTEIAAFSQSIGPTR